MRPVVRWPTQPRTERGEGMASTETAVKASTNGHGEQGEIAVENPATGEVVATVADLGPEDVKAMAQRARAAQPGWEALGFEGRARIMLRAQKWVLDNAERVISTIV